MAASEIAVSHAVSNDVRVLVPVIDRANALGNRIVTYEDVAYTAAQWQGLMARHPTLVLHAEDELLTTEPAVVLRSAADEYERLGLPGRFHVIEALPMIHVVGSSTADGNQPGSPAGPPFDSIVELEAGSGSGSDFVAVFLDSLRAGTRIAIGQLPFNMLAQHRSAWPAQRARARDVLREFALTFPDPLSFSLLYNADTGAHVLNLQTGYQRRGA